MSQRNDPQRQFVDFKALRKSLSFAVVLKHYGIEIRLQKGNRHVGLCPLPTHEGNKRSRSFSAKLDWGVWQCFSCRASGNVLDFAVRMEGLNPQDHRDLRKVALQLQQRFGTATSAAMSTPSKAPAGLKLPPTIKPLPVIVNPPLDFELKNLDYDHPYLLNRGFLPETIRHFGLGYCNRGLMKGRVVIPLHDVDNRLVGYAGRLVDDALVNEFNPKYKFPASREHDHQVLCFDIGRLVYNANRLAWPVEELVIVQGFPAVWWVHQAGYPNVVCIMGATCADGQADIIAQCVRSGGRIRILSDGTGSGDRCAESICNRLVGRYWIHRALLNVSEQPTDCIPDELEALCT